MQRDLTTFMRGAAIAVALTLAASKAIWAQSQNPSPMVETTRAHERLERVELSGVSGSVPGPEGRDVEIFVPSAFTARTPATLVIHFHGAAWLPERAVAGLGKNAVSAVVDLGGGGTRYDRAFSASHTFQRLVDDITRTVSELAGGYGTGGHRRADRVLRRIRRDPRDPEGSGQLRAGRCRAPPRRAAHVLRAGADGPG